MVPTIRMVHNKPDGSLDIGNSAVKKPSMNRNNLAAKSTSKKQSSVSVIKSSTMETEADVTSIKSALKKILVKDNYKTEEKSVTWSVHPDDFREMTEPKQNNRKLRYEEPIILPPKPSPPFHLTKKSKIYAITGMGMPAIGLGTLTRASEQPLDALSLEKVIDTAISFGYRHFDTAYGYNSEIILGKTLQKYFTTGDYRREDFFISTKLPMVAMNAELVEEYLNKSLTNLRTHYVDLYIINRPVGLIPGEDMFPKDEEGFLKLDLQTDHVKIWEAMEFQKMMGRTRYLGVTDFSVAQLQSILDCCHIPPSTIQVECHLYCQQKEICDFAARNGISVTAYAPLGSPAAVKVFNAMSHLSRPQTKSPMLNEVVALLSEKHKKTRSQILLRHLLQLGVCVIPKSSKFHHMRENIDLYDFELSKEEMSKLNALDQGEAGRKLYVSHLLKGYDLHPQCPYSQKEPEYVSEEEENQYLKEETELEALERQEHLIQESEKESDNYDLQKALETTV
uniref:NADP-dependent oxidoreductase domain-containing protein n=1 Tax=Graphocephala atropunctata TaxID=36148 RepID=A0A1B6MT56_9HEMI